MVQQLLIAENKAGSEAGILSITKQICVFPKIKELEPLLMDWVSRAPVGKSPDIAYAVRSVATFLMTLQSS